MSASRATAITAVGLPLVACAALSFAGEQTEFPTLRGPYLGQESPGAEPVLFAPGVVATGTGEWSMAFTPDGLELFFGLFAESGSYIVHTRSVDGRWAEPELASFSGTYPDYDLTMSPDGNGCTSPRCVRPAATGPRSRTPMSGTSIAPARDGATRYACP